VTPRRGRQAWERCRDSCSSVRGRSNVHRGERPRIWAPPIGRSRRRWGTSLGFPGCFAGRERRPVGRKLLVGRGDRYAAAAEPFRVSAPDELIARRRRSRGDERVWGSPTTATIREEVARCVPASVARWSSAGCLSRTGYGVRPRLRRPLRRSGVGLVRVRSSA
jgi:hypothetical protein